MLHKFVSPLPDGTNPELVDHSNWNDVHVRVPKVISSSTIGLPTDDWIQAFAGVGINYTLPSTTGQPVLVQKVDGGAGNVQCNPAFGTINSLNALGQGFYLLTNPGQYAEFTFDGTNYWVTAHN